jgi:hypothetical protein
MCQGPTAAAGRFGSFGTSLWGLMGKPEPQSILKTDECSIALDSAITGNSSPNQAVKITTSFPEGDKPEVAVKNGRWVLMHLPAAPRRPAPMRHYFPTE